jgi:hypothetical protein
MIPIQKATHTETSEIAPSRRFRDLRQITSILQKSGLTPLQACQAIVDDRSLTCGRARFFCGLPKDEKHDWIASLYALLIPKGRRRQLAAYFTPPHLAHYANRHGQVKVRSGNFPDAVDEGQHDQAKRQSHANMSNSSASNIINDDCRCAGKHKHKPAEAFRDQALTGRAHKPILPWSKAAF